MTNINRTQEHNKIKLLIAKNNSFDTSSVEIFLERRDFQVKISVNLDLYAETVKNFQPDYVLLPWDHPQIEKSHKESILNNQNHISIAYSTTCTTIENYNLEKLDFKYKLFAPISGPAVQRMIFKLESHNARSSLNKSDSMPDFISKTKEIHGIYINSDKNSGLILLEPLSDKMNQQDIQLYIQLWLSELIASDCLQKNVIAQKSQSKIFSLPENSIDILQKLTYLKASFQKTESRNQTHYRMSFFELKQSPFDHTLNLIEHYKIIDHNCLIPDQKITFDLFFELKNNHKKIKLYKKETEITQFDINKIKNKKLYPLMISVEDEVHWYQYGAMNFISEKSF